MTKNIILAGDNDKAKDGLKADEAKAKYERQELDKKQYEDLLLSISTKANAGETSMLKSMNLLYACGAVNVSIAEFPVPMKDLDEWITMITAPIEEVAPDATEVAPKAKKTAPKAKAKKQTIKTKK